MATPNEEQTILVRGSAEHREYMRHQAGWLKALVNGLEDYLSIAGRALLLLFLIYTTVKAGMTMMHVNAPIWLEVIMLSLQVAGVEGAVPGLARHKEMLASQRRDKDAKTIGRAINSTRTLAILTGLEIVLYLTPTIAGFDMAPVNDAYSKVLLIARLVVISNFLIAMARMEKQGPKIISQAEHEKKQQESEQARLIVDLQTQLTQANQSSQDFSSQMQSAEQRLADATANLQTARVQIADLSAQLQTAQVQIADLQRAERKTARMQSAPSAKPHAAPVDAQASAPNITPIDQARAKHEATRGKALKVSHAEVLAYLAEHPDLKRAEVAASLGISERKVYDALAWQKEQHAVSQ